MPLTPRGRVSLTSGSAFLGQNRENRCHLAEGPAPAPSPPATPPPWTHATWPTPTATPMPPVIHCPTWTRRGCCVRGHQRLEVRVADHGQGGLQGHLQQRKWTPGSP